MNNFDNVANTWDENPIHFERSQVIAQKMMDILPLGKDMNVLEYGAGTGILSFLLSEKLGHITMMDNSKEMVKVMEGKVLDRHVTNLQPIYYNLEKADFDKSFDLIFNQMVLHHIPDVKAIFEKFHEMLLQGGILAIADLYQEDGSFHDEGFDGHLGFNPEQLGSMLLASGFRNVSYEECYKVKRTSPDGSFNLYPIFLLTALK